MMTDRDFNFRLPHERRFGLQVTEKHLEDIVKRVTCRFCVHFGRSESTGDKRKRIGSIKVFEYPFKASNFKSHLLGQHADNWAAYTKLQCAELQEEFFADAKVGSTFQPHLKSEKPLVLAGELDKESRLSGTASASKDEKLSGSYLQEGDDISDVLAREGSRLQTATHANSRLIIPLNEAEGIMANKDWTAIHSADAIGFEMRKLRDEIDALKRRADVVDDVLLVPLMRCVANTILQLFLGDQLLTSGKPCRKFQNATVETANKIEECAEKLGLNLKTFTSQMDQIIESRHHANHPSSIVDLDLMVTNASSYLDKCPHLRKTLRYEVLVIDYYSEFKSYFVAEEKI